MTTLQKAPKVTTGNDPRIQVDVPTEVIHDIVKQIADAMWATPELNQKLLDAGQTMEWAEDPAQDVYSLRQAADDLVAEFMAEVAPTASMDLTADEVLRLRGALVSAFNDVKHRWPALTRTARPITAAS